MTKIVDFSVAGLTIKIEEFLVEDFQWLAEVALQKPEDDGRSRKHKKDLTVVDIFDALTEQISLLVENKEEWIEEWAEDELPGMDKDDAFLQTVEHLQSLLPRILKLISDEFNQRWDGKIVSKLV